MKLSKCILVATIAFGAQFAAANTSDCAMRKSGMFASNPVAGLRTADAVFGKKAVSTPERRADTGEATARR